MSKLFNTQLKLNQLETDLMFILNSLINTTIKLQKLRDLMYEIQHEDNKRIRIKTEK